MFNFNGIFDIFIPLLIQPLVNMMVVMYALLGQNFVLAIFAATVLVQLVTWPLTMQSMKSSKKMQTLQQSDKWKDAQKKYKNDREKMAQVTMELYREAGVNPAAGCLPTVIQMPLLIAFYSAINTLLAVNPESLLDLTRHLYRFIPFIATIAQQTIPINSQFLWLNLAHPDPYYIMPVLVAGSTWISQKTMAMPSADAQSSAMNQQMQLMMPVMFGFFALNFPSGLAWYWIISSVVRMVIQGFTQGWNFVLPFNLPFRTDAKPSPTKRMLTQTRSSADESVAPAPAVKSEKIIVSNGNANRGDKKKPRRQDRRKN